MWRTACALVVAWFLAGIPLAKGAQPETLPVPDLTDLSVPGAARALAEAGLIFGGEFHRAWTPGEAFPRDRVSAQQPAPGALVPPGSAVLVTVSRATNITLEYDARQLTILNTGDMPLSLADLFFTSGTGPTRRAFLATEWSTALPPGGCAQLWAERPERPTRPANCARFVRWLTTRFEEKLFWLGGAETFRLERSGDVIAHCAVSAGRCDVALPVGEHPEQAAYLVVVYRDDYLMISNPTERWMNLDGMRAVSSTGRRQSLDDLEALMPGDVAWGGGPLLPGTCLVLSELPSPELPPYDCRVVGYVRLAEGTAFWRLGFTVTNIYSLRSAWCPPPRSGQLSLCIVPRR